MAKLFLFVESNTSGTGELFFERAAGLGLQPVLLSGDPGLYPRLSGYRQIRSAGRSVEEMAAALADAGVDGDSIAGIWSSSDAGILPAARLANRLGHAHVDPRAVELCRDKYAMRVRLADTGMNGPPFMLALSGAEASAWARRLGRPVVVKPRTSTGSIGVRLCATPEAAGCHAEALLRDAAYGTDRGIAVEAYVEGPEYSVEIFDGAAIGVTRKHLGAAPSFIEMGHDFPSPGPRAILSSLAEASARAVADLGLVRGPAHVELRLAAEGPQVIEINPRLAGGMIPELVRRAAALDLIEATIRFACGMAYDLRPVRTGAASIRFLCRAEGESVRAVRGLQEARRLPHVVQAEQLDRGLGRSGPVSDFRDRLAYVIAEGETPAEAGHFADAALGRLVPISSTPGESIMNDTGLIRAPLVPEARAIVFRQPEPDLLRAQLEMLARIDQAHVIMLVECGIASPSNGRRALRAIAALSAAGFDDVVGREPVRGLYMAYEAALIERCPEAADTHVARSRNDINATMFAMRCRRDVAALIHELLRLVASIDSAIKRDGPVEMPIFSHRRPGMPGTWELYLSAIAASVLRDAKGLVAVLDQLQICPLGAGAGAGAALPIDPARTAGFLGFTGPASNALDAVAARDAGLRAIAAAAILTSTLGRMAADLQGWFAEQDALTLPDTLVGASSLMPQKRNAFLLEHVLGKAGRTNGALAGALSACHGSPFANSVQVGTEAVSAILDGLVLAREATILAALTVDGARPVTKRFAEMSRTGAAASAALALEVRHCHGLGFREAHRRTGAALRAAGPDDPVRDAAATLGIDAKAIGSANAMTHGGGAGRSAAIARRRERKKAVRALGTALAIHRQRWRGSESELGGAVAAFLQGRE
jgi:argininosuccinate lyase